MTGRILAILVSAMMLTVIFTPMDTGSAGKPVEAIPVADIALVGCWSFDEGVGTIANDTSGNWNNGTLTNAPTWTHFGVNGSALSFNGATSYVDVPDSPSLDVRGDLTAESWVKFDSLGSGSFYPVISKDEGSGSTDKWIFGYAYEYIGQTSLGFHINTNGGSSSWTWSSMWTPSVNTWYHVAVSKNGTAYSFFINGVAKGGGTIPTAIPDADISVMVGRAEGFYFQGQLDEVQLWSRARSISEISDYYNSSWSNYLANESCELELLFDEGAGLTAVDTSGNWNNGTLIGTAAWDSGISGSAMAFDGTSASLMCPDDSSLDVPYLTIEGWVKVPAIPSGNAWMAHHDTGGNGGWWIRIQSDRTVKFNVDIVPLGVATPNTFTTTAQLPANTWAHIAATWDGTEAKIYINGQPVAGTEVRTDLGPISPPSNPLYLAHEWWNGLYSELDTDEVRIWSRALNASEIADYYNSFGTFPHAPIRINDNAGFNESNGVTNWAIGNGTVWNPWIIENWDIDGVHHCIYIGNTTEHFIVRNCTLRDCDSSGADWPYFGDVGLNLHNVTNGTVEYNVVYGNYRGIYLYNNSTGNLVRNNTVWGNEQSCIHISTDSDNNYVSGNRVFNTTSYFGIGWGIISVKSDGNNISGNYIYDNVNVGIYLTEGSNMTLYDNHLWNNSLTGIQIRNGVENATIQSCNITGSDIGLDCWNSTKGIYSDITLTDNEVGMWLHSSSHNNSVLSGVFTNNNQNVVIESEENCIDDLDIVGGSTGLSINSANVNRITDCTLTDVEVGFLFTGSDGNIISGCNVTGSEFGFILLSSDANAVNDCCLQNISGYLSAGSGSHSHETDVEVYQNDADYLSYTNFTEQLAIGGGGNPLFTRPVGVTGANALVVNITGNASDVQNLDIALFLDGKGGNPVDGVTQVGEFVKSHAVSDSDESVALWAPENGTYLIRVFGFNVSGNPGHFNMSVFVLKQNSTAVSITDSSRNIVRGSSIGNCQVGASIIGSTGNTIHHNVFAGNTVQALDDGVNAWNDDYPSGGNRWSDYTDTDAFSGVGQNITGADGIGDIPYDFTGGQDLYPLMNPPIEGKLVRAGIRIDSDDDFDDAHGVANWGTGDGSEGNPWIIENYIIDGTGEGYCIYVGNTTESFVIRNCSLYNTSGQYLYPYYMDAGIIFCNLLNGTASNNSAYNNSCGIYLVDNTRLSKISYNDISNNSIDGIAALNVWMKNEICWNILRDNGDSGIAIQSSDHICVNNNTATGNGNAGIQVAPLYSWGESEGNLVNDNVMQQNHIGLYMEQALNTMVNRNKILENDIGILMTESDFNKINGNIISNNVAGVILDVASNNTFTGNTIDSSNGCLGSAPYYHQDLGLNVYQNDQDWSNYISFEEQLATGDGGNPLFTRYINVTNTTKFHVRIWEVANCPDLDLGIFLDGKGGNPVDGITQTSELVEMCAEFDADEEIGLYCPSNGCYMIRVFGYTVTSSPGQFALNISMINASSGGMTLLDRASRNIIANCNITNNLVGFNISATSNYNDIYLNTFINNGIQAIDDGSLNSWNAAYPTGGNYWDDYTGVDAKNGSNQDGPVPDGFGDTPYTDILGTAGSHDQYPLMSQTSGIYVDNTAPTSLAKMSFDFVIWGNCYVNCTASDDYSGVDYVQLWYRYSPYNVSWSPWVHYILIGNATGPYDYFFMPGLISPTPLGEGYYEFYSIAVDVEGNVEVKVQTAESYWIYDLTPPVVNAGSDESKNSAFWTESFADRAQITWAVDFTYGIASYQWEYAGPGIITFSNANALNSSIVADTDGVYQIWLNVTDGKGLNGSDSFNLVWDTTNVSVYVGLDVITKVQFLQNATASDNGSGISNYTWAMVSGPGTITFGSANAEDTTIQASVDGVYVIRLNVTDYAGNTDSDWFTLTWDTTTPAIVVSSTANATGIWYNVTDANLDKVYWLSGTSNTTDTAPYFIGTSSLAVGWHNITIWAWDLAGNSASRVVTVHIPSTVIPILPVPGIISTNPINGALGVSTSVSIVITFNRTMDRASVQTALGMMNLTNNMTMSLSWNAGNTTLTLAIGPRLDPLTLYTVMIDNTAMDVNGTHMASNYSFSFTTFIDTDRDGTTDSADTDDDGDAVPDTQDAFPLDSTETTDTDSDGLGNNIDPDDDADGVGDSEDLAPLDPSVGGLDDEEPASNLMWIIILLICGILGGILAYWLISKRGSKPPKTPDEEETSPESDSDGTTEEESASKEASPPNKSAQKDLTNISRSAHVDTDVHSPPVIRGSAAHVDLKIHPDGHGCPSCPHPGVEGGTAPETLVNGKTATSGQGNQGSGDGGSSERGNYPVSHGNEAGTTKGTSTVKIPPIKK